MRTICYFYGIFLVCKLYQECLFTVHKGEAYLRVSEFLSGALESKLFLYRLYLEFQYLLSIDCLDFILKFIEKLKFSKKVRFFKLRLLNSLSLDPI